MLVLMGVVIAAALAWLSFVFGRATADRRTNLNHHRMMMLLVDIRGLDDTVPVINRVTRENLDSLLTEYAQLDLKRQ